MSRPTRRRFLQGATLGTASLTVPTFLYGCSKSSGAVVASATAAPPANPFLTWFGIDEAMAAAEAAAFWSDHAPRSAPAAPGRPPVRWCR